MNFWIEDGLVVNLDKITHVLEDTDPRTGEQGIKVYFVGTLERETPLFLEWSKAERFLAYLESNSKRELKNSVADLGEQLARLGQVGKDASLVSIELQNMMQRLQQYLQLMSNITKMLNDTQSSIVKNLKD